MPRRTVRHHVNGRVAPAGSPARRKVVLVVEDFASVGGLIAGLLRQEGYRAVRAWDAQEALRLARGRQPDLILLDLNLPTQDGPEVLHTLRAESSVRRTPIVVVASGAVALSTDDRALVTDVVAKPFDIEIMLNAVRMALGEPVVEVEPRPSDLQDHYLHGY